MDFTAPNFIVSIEPARCGLSFGALEANYKLLVTLGPELPIMINVEPFVSYFDSVERIKVLSSAYITPLKIGLMEEYIVSFPVSQSSRCLLQLFQKTTLDI